MPIALGPFDLLRPLGRGGMGVVYRGVHRDSGSPVAVKLLLSEKAREPSNVEAFRTELRAVAGLSHPHVIAVYDHGLVDGAAEQASGGDLLEGSPWLATEYASGGSLTQRRQKLTWNELKPLIGSLLDALAHAHARGILHLDLKPGNVLLGGRRPGPKLADFGLAQILARSTSEAEVAASGGTPAYMAPEQMLGAWRDFGPWTDLYELGALVWAMLTGRGPFSYGERGWDQLRDRHLHEPVPPLRTTLQVPSGLEGWLRTALEKDPAKRWRRAADAAYALDRLGRVDGDPGVPIAVESAHTVAYDPRLQRTTLVWEAGETETLKQALTDNPGIQAGARSERAQAPPMPRGWRRAPMAPASRPEVAPGISLYDLRALPLTGRHDVRDVLWTTLRDVHRKRDVRAVVLRGPAGCGKSSLARWLRERAHEVGAAVVLEAGHTRQEGPRDGIGSMLARHLRAVGLSRMELRERAEWVLSDDRLALGLTEVIAPTTAAQRMEGVRSVDLPTNAARFAVVEQVLAQLARHRPVLLVLDDVHHAAAAIQLAMSLLVRQRLPALVVLCVQDEALSQRPTEAALLDSLLDDDGVVEVPLAAMAEREIRQLIEERLRVERGLAHRVAQRSGGSPQYAVQVVGHWVHSGVLELGPGGFSVRDGADAALPASLVEVWDARLDAVIGGASPNEVASLELAAALGQQVDDAEWARACALAGLPVAEALLERLLAQRLANRRPEDDGWSWATAMVRESLERSAGDRWAGHHRVCARMLAEQGADSARLGRHHVAAGDFLAGLEPLLRAIDECQSGDTWPRAEMMVRDWERAFEATGLPRSDERWGRGAVRKGALLRMQLRLDEGFAALDEVQNQGEQHGWDDVLVRVAFEQAGLFKAKGDLRAAVDLYERAAEGWVAQGRMNRHARVCKSLAELRLMTGDHVAAMQVAEDGMRSLQTHPDPYTEASLCQALSFAHARVDNVDEAQRYAERAVAICEAGGMVGMEAHARYALGGVLRARGDLQGARDLFVATAETVRGEDDALVMALDLNAAVIDMLLGDFASAVPTLTRVRTVATDRWQILLGVVDMALCRCSASMGNWKKAKRQLAEAREGLAATGHVDPEVADWAIALAGMAKDEGHVKVVRDAWDLAATQLQALGRTEEAERAAAERDAV